MSVSEYSFEKIHQLYADIRAVTSWLPTEVREKTLKMALRSAYIANKAALAYTCGGVVKIVPMEEPEGMNMHPDMEQLFIDIGLLLRNCIAKGGRDFLPQRDRKVLENIRIEIAWDLVLQGREVRA
jgi:hypothetical protein